MCDCAGNFQHLQRLSLAELDDDSSAFLASSDFAPTVVDDTAREV